MGKGNMANNIPSNAYNIMNNHNSNNSNNAEYNNNHPNMNNNLKDQLKMNGQLKLNLSPLFNAQKPNPVNGKVEIKGFHEEFMARLDEFSQSWRMAAMAEKKF